MASSRDPDENAPPKFIVTSPTFGPKQPRISRKLSKLSLKGDSEASGSHAIHRRGHGKTKDEKHVRLEEPSSARSRPVSASSSIYRGSFTSSPRRSRVSLSGSLRSPDGSVPPSPRESLSYVRLNELLRDVDVDLETYGVEEYRDGFFDANFFKPRKDDPEDLLRMAEYTLPEAFRKKHPLSLSNFLPKQFHEVKGVFLRVTTTRAGIRLTKSFLAFFIAYILCLVPKIGNWLGRYNYILPLSTILNSPCRTIGAQIDGSFFTTLGAAAGLGWGSFALWVSNSTSVAAAGYGGILALFLVLFVGFIAALRSYFIRFYQMVLCAGLAIIYTLLAETQSSRVTWEKLLDFAYPWLFGQAITLLICCTVFPDAGARPLAVALHNALGVMQDGLKIPHPDDVVIHRQLSWTFVNLSQAYRDLVLDISVTRFHPDDVLALRNLMQGVVRSLLSLKVQSNLFGDVHEEISETDSADGDSVIDMDGVGNRPSIYRTDSEAQAVKLVTEKLAKPTMELLTSMKGALASCDAVLLDMSSYRKYLGPPPDVSSDIPGALTRIRRAMIRFDQEDEALTEDPLLPPTYSNHPEVVDLFLFANPIRQAADAVQNLLVKVNEMQQKHRGWRIYLPRYPFIKGLQRTNAQVRHDRGGLSAGFYFRSQQQLNKMMHEIQMNTYRPPLRHLKSSEPEEEYHEEDRVYVESRTAETNKLRYKIWLVLHRLQGFETRFALKAAIVCTLLSIPAWLEQSRDWYNLYQIWWAPAMAWIMMHPRVGGNFQDLITRSLCGVLGAIWGGFAYAARDGNSYVIAVFAAIFMIPMLYRFTQSTHPRSGIVGCISFTVVSLSAKYSNGALSVTTIAWTHGTSTVVGVVSAVVVNWILWPFVARHELRKSLAAMLFHSAIIYRGVVAKYIYYDGAGPQKADVAYSELLEGRLREGFVRMRQLMALTRHEIRLRAPFDPLPYSGLIDACDAFFERLVEVRQSSLFFHPLFLADNEEASQILLPYRRDAVAAILMTLYILAGALRGNRRVPRYLPNAALARKKLLDRMAELEIEHAAQQREQRLKSGSNRGSGRKFAEVYQFAYSKALTQCVEQLEQLQRFTKAIVGEVGFDLEIVEDDGEGEDFSDRDGGGGDGDGGGGRLERQRQQTRRRLAQRHRLDLFDGHSTHHHR